MSGSKSPKFLVAIPARFESTRFPGKPLALVHGLPMIVQVIQAVFKEPRVSDVAVLTDDERIRECVEKNHSQLNLSTHQKVHLVMTAKSHPSGTDRIYEGVQKLAELGERFDFVVNVQGDEPMIQTDHLSPVIDLFFKNPNLQMATIATPLKTDEIANPNVVKVVRDYQGNGLYFSRHAIPFTRMTVEQVEKDDQGRVKPASGIESGAVLKHIGLYGYSVSFLKTFCETKPSFLERAESLEQLRALSLGVRIQVVQVDRASIGVDTPEDLDKINRLTSL